MKAIVCVFMLFAMPAMASGQLIRTEYGGDDGEKSADAAEAAMGIPHTPTGPELVEKAIQDLGAKHANEVFPPAQSPQPTSPPPQQQQSDPQPEIIVPD